MWIHFALFSTLLLPAALLGLRGRAGRRGSPVLLGVAFVAFVAFSSLRAVSVGNDTVEYHRVFKAIAATDSFQEARPTTMPVSSEVNGPTLITLDSPLSAR